MKRILAALLLLAAGAAAQAESAMRIQYAEPVSLKATPGIVSFDAYGRRFDLELTNNERVTSKFSPQRKAELARYHIFRGALVGQAHSWARLTESAAAWKAPSGMGRTSMPSRRWIGSRRI